MTTDTWLDKPKDSLLLVGASLADVRRVRYDQRRLDLNQEAGYDAGFEAGVLATEAGLGRYSD